MSSVTTGRLGPTNAVSKSSLPCAFKFPYMAGNYIVGWYLEFAGIFCFSNPGDKMVSNTVGG